MASLPQFAYNRQTPCSSLYTSLSLVFSLYLFNCNLIFGFGIFLNVLIALDFPTSLFPFESMWKRSPKESEKDSTQHLSDLGILGRPKKSKSESPFNLRHLLF